MRRSYQKMASYTEANVKYILPYWDVLKWTTEPNATMVKYIVGKWYANGTDVTTTSSRGEHRMIKDLMSSAIYATVSETPFAAPTAPVLTIPPTATHSQLASYECEHKEKLILLLNFKHFREAMKNPFVTLWWTYTPMSYPKPLSSSKEWPPMTWLIFFLRIYGVI